MLAFSLGVQGRAQPQDYIITLQCRPRRDFLSLNIYIVQATLLIDHAWVTGPQLGQSVGRQAWFLPISRV